MDSNEIKILRSRTARAQQLRAQLSHFHAQRDDLAAREADLRAQRIDEEDDVTALECRSLARWFYSLTGSLDGRLDRERSEARAAAVRHDAALRELEALDGAIASAAAELEALRGCEEDYAGALRRRAAEIKASGSAAGERLEALERELARLERRRREIEEAAAEGRRAQQTARAILDDLSEASELNTVDYFVDSFFFDLAKHEHLDRAQTHIESLQAQMRRFGTELGDVGGGFEDMGVNIDSFLRFADFFFDDFFTEFAVGQRINSSMEQVSRAAGRIEDALARLQAMAGDCESDRRRLEREYESLVSGAGEPA